MSWWYISEDHREEYAHFIFTGEDENLTLHPLCTSKTLLFIDGLSDRCVSDGKKRSKNTMSTNTATTEPK